MNPLPRECLGVPQPMTSWAIRGPSTISSESNAQLEHTINELRSHIEQLKKKGMEWAFTACARMVNPFELVPDVARQPHEKVISRAYYKLLEIMKVYKLGEEQLGEAPLTEEPLVEGQLGEGHLEKKVLKNSPSDRSDLTKVSRFAALLCEAPGGFAQCLNHDPNIQWDMTCISLLEKGIVMDDSQKGVLFAGGDGTGNLLEVENITAFAEHVSKSTGGRMADLCTADGGFEVDDRNNQELFSVMLVVAQTLAAMLTLKPGGSLVLKLFDTYSDTSEMILYILNNLFNDASLYKPFTSRVCNSEKYFIGTDYVGLQSDVVFGGSKTVQDVVQLFKDVLNNGPDDIVEFHIVPHTFKQSLKNYNVQFTSMQAAYLTEALNATRIMQDQNKTSREAAQRLVAIFKEEEPMAHDMAVTFCTHWGIPVALK